MPRQPLTQSSPPLLPCTGRGAAGRALLTLNFLLPSWNVGGGGGGGKEEPKNTPPPTPPCPSLAATTFLGRPGAGCLLFSKMGPRWGAGGSKHHSQLLVVGIVQCRPLVLLMRLPLDGLVVGVQVRTAEAVTVLQEPWREGIPTWTLALGSTPHLQGLVRSCTWGGCTWWVPRWSLDPGDAEGQGAGPGREWALGRPGRGRGSCRVRGQGCHSARLLLDYPIQHLGIEGVGG